MIDTASDPLVMDAAMRERGVTEEYRRATAAKGRAFRRGPVGCAEPRLFTPPLRPLTPETSLGFEVIEYAEQILGVELYPWQKVLLIRGLELRPDGRYRFRRLVVLVGRQNGKTTLAAVLAAWWLFVDSKRHPDRLPPVKFKVVGVAQNLDIAREPWNTVKLWCDPDPETEEAGDLAIPALQDATEKVIDTNGKEGIYTLDRPHYEIRAAKSARGKPSPRVLFDELREQDTWAAWNAVVHTTKSFFNGQLWGFSNAGDASSVLLTTLRDGLLTGVKEWQEYVESGLRSLEEFANGRDTTAGIFEWSAIPGCALDDIDAILQSNPSIGHGEMTVEACLADVNTPDYRTEVLCQWVTSRKKPFLNADRWRELLDEESDIEAGGRIVAGVSVTIDGRSYFSHVGVAGHRPDGLGHLELLTGREGHLWVLDYMEALRKKQGIREVAIQSKGVPSAELVKPLEEAGFIVHRIEATPMLLSAGYLRNAVERGDVRHREDARLDFTVEYGTTKPLGGMPVWDLFDSPVDVAPVVCVNLAYYALETIAPPKKKDVPPPPPQAEVVVRDDIDASEVNLATARF
ncbi:hypothetical protein L332_03555 [Agrococcus pavilionensis RW1]|uniref:Terminase n=1 Tax=Agrococcus pavilionensis RW1 TaxID=1330458 RepID=U1MS89_9MICO|nr:terminase [Agrococcus pavilionensis]ERG63530.1 hypothetical protein L332_03555 [Agrococcus pavilionensis RW1]